MERNIWSKRSGNREMEREVELGMDKQRCREMWIERERWSKGWINRAIERERERERDVERDM